jgi:hypothetical protein
LFMSIEGNWSAVPRLSEPTESGIFAMSCFQFHAQQDSVWLH